MKFPLDQTTYVEFIQMVVEHEKSQTLLIQKMGELLEAAMDYADESDEWWYQDSETLLKELHSLKMWHESRRFNESNAKAQMPKDYGSNARITPNVKLTDDPFADIPEGGELSEDDLAKHFAEKKAKKSKEKEKPLDKMSLEEIESWEKQQENSNDLYKIKARVANLARGNNASLTAQGEMLCNTYVHVMKAFYDFADKLEDKDLKIRLSSLIRSQEGMPGNLIAAAGAGVKEKSDEKSKRKT